jgi:hypothetical protein
MTEMSADLSGSLIGLSLMTGSNSFADFSASNSSAPTIESKAVRVAKVYDCANDAAVEGNADDATGVGASVRDQGDDDDHRQARDGPVCAAERRANQLYDL